MKFKTFLLQMFRGRQCILKSLFPSARANVVYNIKKKMWGDPANAELTKGCRDITKTYEEKQREMEEKFLF